MRLGATGFCLVVVIALFGWVPSAAADEEPVCVTTSTILGTTTTCTYTAESLKKTAESDSEAVYTVFQACLNGTSGQPEPCSNPRACEVAGETGTLYGVRRNGVPVGTVCLTTGDSKVFTPPIAAVVAKRFKAIDWPKSALSVEPRDGQTLVNFETIFYTTNDRPTTKLLTLLGQKVEVEATPTSYIWHFGDDSSATTASAGNPYPDQDVVHTFQSLEPADPSVDTVYSGRFRVNGGEWETIEETVTVVGDAVDLEILEATPELVTDPEG